ncbi:MAG: hypothetical protein OJF47_003590 [Nitrospira sp.]|jgi:hypothetical protein|nr:MAG: hypothetical protein OJF47_003590 [Nitrospira sp.]
MHANPPSSDKDDEEKSVKHVSKAEIKIFSALSQDETAGTARWIEYVEEASGKPARLALCKPWPVLSERRMRRCSRILHEECGLGL